MNKKYLGSKNIHPLRGVETDAVRF